MSSYQTLGDITFPTSGTVNTPDHYRHLDGTVERTLVGERFKEGGFYYNDALRKMIEQGIIPTNRLEYTWVKFDATYTKEAWGYRTGAKYYGCKRKINYRSIFDYLYSLDHEYDPDLFLQLAKLHEAAGLAFNTGPLGSASGVGSPIVDITSCDTKTPGPGTRLNAPRINSVIMGGTSPYASISKEHSVIEPYFPYDIFVSNYKGNDTSYIQSTRANNLDADKGEPIGWVGIGLSDYAKVIETYRYQRYVGNDLYNSTADLAPNISLQGTMPFPPPHNPLPTEYAKSYLLILGRFRERILAMFLKEIQFLLWTAHLEDLDTVRTAYQYFLGSWRTVYDRINAWETINVNTNGQVQTYDRMHLPLNITIRIVDRGGTPHNVSVIQYLKLQFESVAWLFIYNKCKLEGRLAQLQDPNSVLTETPVTSWQMDPWQNPFLIFDPTQGNILDPSVQSIVGMGPQSVSDAVTQSGVAMTAGSKIVPVTGARFVNVAANVTQNQTVVPPSGVVSTFVPLKNMLEAPAIFQQYNRVTTPYGIGFSQYDINQGGTSIMPLVLLAAGAVGIYLANR